jgi:peptide deformylase
MSLLTIHTYPDHCLRKQAGEVTTFDDQLVTLTQDMAQTMYEAPGIGLAAPQVNINQRVVVIDVSEAKNDLRILINPQINRLEGEQEYEEGCLSIPGEFGIVSRAAQIHVQALDLTGSSFEFDAEGLLAICVQHEIDHLNGVLFIDHLSKLKRDRIKKRLKKEARQSA